MSTTTSGSRTRAPRRKLGVILLALAVAFGVGVPATPAFAGDERCTSGSQFSPCGSIWANVASLDFNISTGFAGRYSSVLGTASGVSKRLKHGTSSNQFKDSKGRFYDWDAIFVPYRKCIALRTGVAYVASSSYCNKSYALGVWYKVDNLGATVTMKSIPTG